MSKTNENGNAIGIDLGTTMSAIAYLNSVGKPETIANSEGERLTPSAIMFKGNNDIKVGRDAKQGATEAPGNVGKEFKRKMEDPDYRFDFEGKSFSAAELSSFILKKLVQDASKELGEIKDVVISVPAYFKEIQRDATIEAGKLAGLNVLAIINEPTAAAIYYATVDNVNGKCLVYDLGGGTFDVTIVNIEGQSSEIVTSVGDPNLGGIDFDQLMLELFKEKYKKEMNGDLYNEEDESEHEEFILLAEDVKKRLSFSKTIKQKLKGEAGRCTIEITEEEFEEKLAIYISQTELLLEQALDEANVKPSDITNILLVGGSTRIPAIRKSIQSVLGQEPIEKVNVDEAVALGAALKAGLVMIKEKPGKLKANLVNELSTIKVQEVTNSSYGTICLASNSIEKKYINWIIIPKNTPIPCTKSENFNTVYDNQDAINVRITQGEGDDPEYVDEIHNQTIPLPTGRPAGQPIKHTYSYDENQIMKCLIKDINANKTTEISLTMTKKKTNQNSVSDFLID